MKNVVLNAVVETLEHADGVYEIKVHPFSDDEIGLYEDGLRNALKRKEEDDGTTLLIDFSAEAFARNLSGRTLFDLFQSISFNCMRYKKVFVKWNAFLMDYLANHAADKTMQWKMSRSTVSKLINLNYVF